MAHKDKNQRLQEKYQAILSAMLREEENKYCADCDAKGPRWTSWNLGIFLCIRCAGIHRKLGVHISKVKSVNLDQWTAEQVASMQAVGNSKAKAIYEHSLSDNYRRSQSDTAMEQFIRAKYETQKWMLPGYKPQSVVIPPDLLEDDRDSAKKSSTKQIELPKPPEFKKTDTVKATTTTKSVNPSTTGVVASSKPAVQAVDSVLFSFDDNEPNLFGNSNGVQAPSSSSGINQIAASGTKSNLDEIEFEFKSSFTTPSVESQSSNNATAAAHQPNLFGGPDKTIDNIMAMFKTIPTSQSSNMGGFPTSSSSMNIGSIGGPSVLPSSNSSVLLNQQQQFAQPNNHFQGLSDPFANNNNNQRAIPSSTAANVAFANLIPSNFNSTVKTTNPNMNMFPSQQQGQQFPNLFAPQGFGMMNPTNPSSASSSSTVNPATVNNNLFSNTLSSDLWQ